VEAIGMLPTKVLSHSSCLIVAREGPLKPQLESIIAKYKLQGNVRLLGFLPRRDMVQLLKQSDLFVLPSRVAIFDVVLLEAALSGAPVVTSTVGGNIEMFDKESAFLIPCDSPSILAETIMRALSNRALCQQISTNAKKRVLESFSLESLSRSYIMLYKEMLSAWHG